MRNLKNVNAMAGVILLSAVYGNYQSCICTMSMLIGLLQIMLSVIEDKKIIIIRIGYLILALSTLLVF